MASLVILNMDSKYSVSHSRDHIHIHAFITACIFSYKNANSAFYALSEKPHCVSLSLPPYVKNYVKLRIFAHKCIFDSVY